MEKFKIDFTEENIIEINISEKFIGERGRINCSLREMMAIGDGLVFNTW